MDKFNVAFCYVSLHKAAELLGVSENELIHAGAFEKIQICVNIYGRATNTRRTRFETSPQNMNEYGPELVNPLALNEVDSQHIAITNLTKSYVSQMPEGVFGLESEALRFFEMPETKNFELYEAKKFDETGLWNVEFDPPITIERGDIVVLSAEIERISANGSLAVPLKKMDTPNMGSETPWNIHDSRDPKPEQSWYTPARYFARQLVLEDTTLLTKREVLADKVSRSLSSVNVYKRGGKKKLSASTVLKAFANVKFD